jgi:hypothetical protein
MVNPRSSRGRVKTNYEEDFTAEVAEFAENRGGALSSAISAQTPAILCG